MLDRHLCPAVFLVVVSVAILACGDDPVQTVACYPFDPGPPENPIQSTHELRFCPWRPHEIPMAPNEISTYTIVECVPVGSGEECEACDPEKIDALSMEKIAEQCCEPVEEFIRGCHWRRTNVDGTESYCYGAKPAVSHPAPSCDPERKE